MLTEKRARSWGYEIVRGAYANTMDDRIDRWYVQRDSDSVVDRRGGGYRTKREALAAIEEYIVESDFYAKREAEERAEVAADWERELAEDYKSGAMD